MIDKVSLGMWNLYEKFRICREQLEEEQGHPCVPGMGHALRFWLDLGLITHAWTQFSEFATFRRILKRMSDLTRLGNSASLEQTFLNDKFGVQFESTISTGRAGCNCSCLMTSLFSSLFTTQLLSPAVACRLNFTSCPHSLIA